MDKLAVRLQGSSVALEPLADAHREGLWEAARPPEIWRWTSRIAESRESFDSWFEVGLTTTRSRERAVFAIVDCHGSTPIGSTSFHDFYPTDRVVEIGATWLNPNAWGSGANIEAKLLMLQYAFEDLELVRVERKTDARNERSRRALAAIPAQFEGILRKQKTLPGVGVRDSATYSVVDDEWAAVRDNLRRRLAAQR